MTTLTQYATPEENKSALDKITPKENISQENERIKEEIEKYEAKIHKLDDLFWEYKDLKVKIESVMGIFSSLMYMKGIREGAVSSPVFTNFLRIFWFIVISSVFLFFLTVSITTIVSFAYEMIQQIIAGNPPISTLVFLGISIYSLLGIGRFILNIRSVFYYKSLDILEFVIEYHKTKRNSYKIRIGKLKMMQKHQTHIEKRYTFEQINYLKQEISEIQTIYDSMSASLPKFKKYSKIKYYEEYRKIYEQSVQYMYEEILSLQEELKTLLKNELLSIQTGITETSNLKNNDMMDGNSVGNLLEIQLKKQEEQFQELLKKI